MGIVLTRPYTLGRHMRTDSSASGGVLESTLAARSRHVRTLSVIDLDLVYFDEAYSPNIRTETCDALGLRTAGNPT